MSETTTTTTISDFLLARIAEDEAEARAATEGPWIAYDVGDATEHAPGWWWVWREKALPFWGGVMEPEDSHLPNCIPNSVVGSCGISDGRDSKQDEADARHIARHNPARVLAECEAKRTIVEIHKTYKLRPPALPSFARDPGLPDFGCGCCADDTYYANGWCDTIRALVSVYADHPDYQQEWRA